MNPNHKQTDWSDAPTTLAIDPHLHSVGSYDGTEPVERLLAVAADRGLDGLVVTDHDEIDQSLRAVELAPEYGLFALPGVEVSTRHGHLLAIGVESAPTPDLPVTRTVRRVRNAGGVTVVPHPFQRSRHGVPRRAIGDCDGIETLNACSVLNVRNEQARRFAARHDYPRFGGSDAHVASEVGRAYTEVALDELVKDPTSVDPDAVLAAIRHGDTRACGTRSRRRRSIRKYARNARVKSARVARSPVDAAVEAVALLGRQD